MEQLIKKNCNEGTYENMYPITVIQAIKDLGSDLTLDVILEKFNHLYLPFIDRSKTLTRMQVPEGLRRKGLWITYISYNDNVVTEWYDSEDFSDKAWGDSKNWIKYIDDNAVAKVIENIMSRYTYVELDDFIRLKDRVKDVEEKKVDKEEGKGLSSNDFSDDDKNNLKTLTDNLLDLYPIEEGELNEVLK